MPATPFLAARWRWLAILTFEADRAWLAPHLARGTELDDHEGRVLLSLVGFRFLDTRLRALPALFHRAFDEVNLRFYVRREVDGQLRRGVTFIREIVSRRLIVAVARVAYNEPYVACPMRSEVPTGAEVIAVRATYAWRSGGRWRHIGVAARGVPRVPVAGSLAAFVTQRAWGYTPQRDGGTVEYAVDHPVWSVWDGGQAETGGIADGFGPGAGAALGAPPVSVLLAEGSRVTVSSPRRVND